jgi:hypothetical protein
MYGASDTRLLVEQNNPKVRETGNISQFIGDYGLYPPYLQTTARSVAI